MTLEIPPLLTPPPARKEFAWAAWLVIAAMAMFLVIRNQAASDQIQASGGPMVAMQLNFLGKVTVGTFTATRQFGNSTTVQMGESADRLIQRMAADAVSPEDKLHVAIITGEIKGVDQASAKLNDLAGSGLSPEMAGDVATLRQIYAGNGASLDSAARAGLAERHGFFGQVALAYGVAADTEPRKSMEAAAGQMVVRMALVGGGILLIFLASAVLFVTAVVLIATGKIRRAYTPDPGANSAYLEGFALYLAAYVGLGYLLRFLGINSLLGSWLALLIIPLVWYWTTRRGESASQSWRSLGWHPGQGWPKEMALGVAGYLACLPIEILGFIMTLKLVALSHAEPTHPITGMLGGGFWQVLALYGLACVMAPVLEETMFRGALFHHLRRHWGWLPSTALVSLLFAMIHPQGWTFIPALGSVAVVLAILREWRGSIIASMTAHAFSNFLVLSMALLILR